MRADRPFLIPGTMLSDSAIGRASGFCKALCLFCNEPAMLCKSLPDTIMVCYNSVGWRLLSIANLSQVRSINSAEIALASS